LTPAKVAQVSHDSIAVTEGFGKRVSRGIGLSHDGARIVDPLAVANGSTKRAQFGEDAIAETDCLWVRGILDRARDCSCVVDGVSSDVGPQGRGRVGLGTGPGRSDQE